MTEDPKSKQNLEKSREQERSLALALLEGLFTEHKAEAAAAVGTYLSFRPELLVLLGRTYIKRVNADPSVFGGDAQAFFRAYIAKAPHVRQLIAAREGLTGNGVPPYPPLLDLLNNWIDSMDSAREEDFSIPQAPEARRGVPLPQDIKIPEACLDVVQKVKKSELPHGVSVLDYLARYRELGGDQSDKGYLLLLVERFLTGRDPLPLQKLGEHLDAYAHHLTDKELDAWVRHRFDHVQTKNNAAVKRLRYTLAWWVKKRNPEKFTPNRYAYVGDIALKLRDYELALVAFDGLRHANRSEKEEEALNALLDTYPQLNKNPEPNAPTHNVLHLQQWVDRVEVE